MWPIILTLLIFPLPILVHNNIVLSLVIYILIYRSSIFYVIEDDYKNNRYIIQQSSGYQVIDDQALIQVVFNRHQLVIK